MLRKLSTILFVLAPLAIAIFVANAQLVDKQQVAQQLLLQKQQQHLQDQNYQEQQDQQQQQQQQPQQQQQQHHHHHHHHQPQQQQQFQLVNQAENQLDINNQIQHMQNLVPIADNSIHHSGSIHSMAASGNSITTSGHQNNKKNSALIHHQNLNKLQKYLNERQHELIKKNPGSLLAVARALKMAIIECQYQMRHEPWDCPIYGFSMKPVDIFGQLMSRSFKETSFIHSLLSSAIAHSITRACTESMILTCGRKQTRDDGYSEDFEFGRRFAQQFMDATHELPATNNNMPSTNANNIDRNLDNNIIVPQAGSEPGSGGEPILMAPYQQQSSSTSSGQMEPSRRERRIRNMINAHNDEVGRLHVLNGMRRECKCHGLSGACNVQTCWLKLPPFREVATKLHDSLDQAIRVVYVSQNPANRQKSLTSTVKKSNKKRSSVQPVNGLTARSSTSSSLPPVFKSSSSSSFDPYSGSSLYASATYSDNSLTSDKASIIGSRQRSGQTKRQTSASDNDCEDCNRAPVGDTYHSQAYNYLGFTERDQSTAAANLGIPMAPRDFAPGRLPLAANNNNNNNSTVVKRRPVARSIGIGAYPISPSKTDLLYYEESPDYCVPSKLYNIKGTTGRECSILPNANNSCKKLCCGRGYKTEVREEKYKCDCQFKFCCKLDCNICKRKQTVHKCL